MHIFTFTQKPKSRVTEIETIKPESEEKKRRIKPCGLIEREIYERIFHF